MWNRSYDVIPLFFCTGTMNVERGEFKRFPIKIIARTLPLKIIHLCSLLLLSGLNGSGLLAVVQDSSEVA